jgi:hypothetical protein
MDLENFENDFFGIFNTKLNKIVKINLKKILRDAFEYFF